MVCLCSEIDTEIWFVCDVGDDLSQVPKSREERIADVTLEAYQKAAVEDASAWREEQALLQVAPSSSLVKLDENGEPFEDR